MWRRTWSSPSTTRMNCTSAEQRTQMARGTRHRAATIPRPPVHPAAGNPSRPSPRLKQARPAPGAGQPPGGRLDADCGCARRRRWCAGRDLRPLGEIHLRLRHSSPPAASNRSAPSAQHRRQHRRNRWSPRTAARRAFSLTFAFTQRYALDRCSPTPTRTSPGGSGLRGMQADALVELCAPGGQAPHHA